ncbi:dihydrofolate reductase family protein [Stetteria hydrogenophila]
MKPYTFIFSTMSVDGRIAGETGFSRLSCHEDFVLQHRLRAQSDAVMVGAGTVLADNPRLTVRLTPGKSPARVVVDGRLRSRPDSRVYQGPGLRVLITSTRWGPEDLKPYREAGVEVIQAPEDSRGLVDLRLALEDLRESYNVRRLMVEGGGRLNYELLARRLVDEVRVTISPLALGSGTSIFQKPEARMEPSPGPLARFILVDYKPVCGNWLHLVYKILYD